MDTKIIILSAVLVIMSFCDAEQRSRRSPGRELQTSLTDIIHGGNVESRIWKRAIPRDIKKTTKSNEAIPEFDTHPVPLYNTQSNAPSNSDELSEPDTSPPATESKNLRKTAPTGIKTPPYINRSNPGVKSPRNTKPKINPATPKPSSLPDPSSLLNSDETENPDSEKMPESPSTSIKAPINHKIPRPNIKSRKPTVISPKQPNYDDEDNGDENPENENDPEEPRENENEPEENNEDDKEPEENTEDEEEPEENTEVEVEPDENTEDEKEPEENTEDDPQPEGNTEDLEEPEEYTEKEEEPEDNIEDENEPEESKEGEGKSQGSRPKSPTDTKQPRRPSSTLEPPRPASTHLTKPPPPFPGDRPIAGSKKPRTESPITYIRPFKSTITTPHPTPTENDDSNENDEPADDDDNTEENPAIIPTPTSKRRPGIKNSSKAPTRARDNNTPTKISNRKSKPVEPSPSIDTDDSSPDTDNFEPENDTQLNESPDDDSNESSDQIPTTTTKRPRTAVKKRPKTSTKQRPTRPRNPPCNPADDEDLDTTPESEKLPDMGSRFADTEQNTQSQENPDNNASKSPSKSPNRPQYPTFNPMSQDPFKNNPFLSSPSGLGAANTFSSSTAGGNAGASASASASASSSAGAPSWNSWPNFPNRFANPSIAPPPMFFNNPFLNAGNNPNNQQIPNSPFSPNLFNNNNDPKNRPIRGDTQSSSPSKSEPRGYTPIISISGSFDTNNPSISSRSSFPSSDSTSGSMDKSGYDSQTNINAPSHGPMVDADFDRFFGRMSNFNSNSNYGNPPGAGGFASASSFANAGAGGSSLSSPFTNGGGRYPGNNDIGGFPVGGEAQIWGSPFAQPNWAQDQFNAISAQNRAIQEQIQSNIQQQIQQQQQQLQSWGSSPEYNPNGNGNTEMPGGFQSNGPLNSGGGYQTQTYDPFSILNGYQTQQSNPFQQSSPSQQGYPSEQNFPTFDLSQRFGGFGTPGSDGSAFAFGAASAGPGGSSQIGHISPVSPNFQSRFAESSPSSSGGSYGTFSSSKSSTIIGPDGKPISHKVVTTGVNDNGKVSFKTIHD